MKWDVYYSKQSTSETLRYSQDNELNCLNTVVEAHSADDAIRWVKQDITELMNCNCLEVEDAENGLSVFEPSDHELIERYFNFRAIRVYQLLDENSDMYFSDIPGTIGGHRRLKIYGRLDCPSALRHIAKGEYVSHRVFFADEAIAKAAGYRPCAICMRSEYNIWKADHYDKEKCNE